MKFARCILTLVDQSIKMLIKYHCWNC